MAFRPSPWLEINDGNLDDGGRSKRLCTGLGNASEPRSTIQTQRAHNQVLLEQSPYVGFRESSIFVNQGWPASAIEFNDVPWHVGGVQSPALFQSHQDLPWSSSDHNLRPSWFEVANSAPSAYHQVPDVQDRVHPASNAYNAWNLPNSWTRLQSTPTSNTSHGGTLRDEHHQSDGGTIPQHGRQDSVFDGTLETENRLDTGHEDTSYELCLGLVGHFFLWHEVLRPR